MYYKLYAKDKRSGVYIEQYFDAFYNALNAGYNKIYEGYQYVCIYNSSGEKIYDIKHK